MTGGFGRQLRAVVLSPFVGQRLTMLASKEHHDPHRSGEPVHRSRPGHPDHRPDLPAGRGTRRHAPPGGRTGTRKDRHHDLTIRGDAPTMSGLLAPTCGSDERDRRGRRPFTTKQTAFRRARGSSPVARRPVAREIRGARTFQDPEEIIRVERLADVLVRAGLERPEPVRAERSSRDDHDGDVPGGCGPAERREDGEAIDPGHHEVERDDVGFEGLDQRQPAGRVQGRMRPGDRPT